jgi:hypothetical protein
MKENDNRENEQERNDVTNQAMAQYIETMQKKIGHPVPLVAVPEALSPTL